MLMKWWTVGLISAALAGSLVAKAGEARACGGCFAPPGAAQVVTDHRMVLSLARAQTTLWDQFQYSGSPEEFSWILPIRYTDSTRVELASDDFLTLLTNVLVPAMNQPSPPPLPPGCSPPWNSGWGGAADASAPPQDAASSADAGVVVLRQEVVGPYAVAIVRGATGMGLRDWLRMNGYTVPTAVEPVIDHYLGLGMDFIALRLRAGKGLNRMAPVRVTLDGYQPRLPLRMIAAGVADRVGLSLTVVAESRIEAMNFPNAQFTDDDFTYDWSSPPRDLGRVFLDAFNARNRAMGDRVWLTESAMRVDRDNLSFLAARLPRRTGFGPDGGAGASAVDDVGVAFMGIGATAVATRMRADLPARMLDLDLDLAASDLGLRDRTYRFGRELNRPMYSACPWPVDGGSGEVPRDASPADAGSPDDAGPPADVGSPDAAFDGGAVDAAAPTPTVSSGGLQCAASRAGGSSPDGAALAAGVVALALCLRRARRAR